jgi:IS5 family transposase
MGPKSATPQKQHLFGDPLDQHLNLKYPLIQLAALIDWAEIDKTFSGHFVSDCGSPALPSRLVASGRGKK